MVPLNNLTPSAPFNQNQWMDLKQNYWSSFFLFSCSCIHLNFFFLNINIEIFLNKETERGYIAKKFSLNKFFSTAFSWSTLYRFYSIQNTSNQLKATNICSLKGYEANFQYGFYIFLVFYWTIVLITPQLILNQQCLRKCSLLFFESKTENVRILLLFLRWI